MSAPTTSRGAKRLDAGPLLRQIDLRGGAAELGIETFSAEFWALRKARDAGTVTVWQADKLAVRLLGLTPLELWGNDYLSA
jgi:hypothetical protein